MSTYRKTWDCCGDTTETECWEPSVCPFCAVEPRAPISVSEVSANTLEKMCIMHRNKLRFHHSYLLPFAAMMESQRETERDAMRAALAVFVGGGKP